MPSIAGWVSEGNVVRLLEHISRYIGYHYDDLDESALTGALELTDDESDSFWFSYPLEGRPALTVSMARAAGSGVVSVRVEGDADAVLTARIETLLDLL